MKKWPKAFIQENLKSKILGGLDLLINDGKPLIIQDGDLKEWRKSKLKLNELDSIRNNTNQGHTTEQVLNDMNDSIKKNYPTN